MKKRNVETGYAFILSNNYDKIFKAILRYVCFQLELFQNVIT